MRSNTLALFALTLTITLASPVYAKVSGEDYRSENALVRSFADDFTDAYGGSILLLDGDDSAARIYHLADGRFVLQFYDQERVHDIPSDEEEVEVVFRVDDQDAEHLTAFWSARNNNATAVVDPDFVDDLAASLIGATEIIYRVGDGGEILRIQVPLDMPALITDFERRVRAGMGDPEENNSAI